MARTTSSLLSAFLFVAVAPGCGDESSTPGQPRTCGSPTCTGGGICFEEGGFAWCACPGGMHPEGLSCVPDNPAVPCDGVVCGGNGWCRVGTGGVPACECFEGHHPAFGGDLTCVPDAVLDGGPDVDADVPSETGDEGVGEDGEAGIEGDDDAGAEDAVEADSGCTGQLDGPCHLSQQCGCPDGERCVAVASGTGGFIEACAPDGTMAVGTACTMMTDDCVAGSQCLPPFGQFACERYCITPADCAGTACQGGALPGTLYGFCEPPVSACVPVTNFGCGAGGACRVIPAASLRTYCGTEGPGGEDADCLAEGCQGGFACHITDLSTIRCRKYCLLASGTCTTGTCTDVYGNGSVGLCLP